MTRRLLCALSVVLVLSMAGAVQADIIESWANTGTWGVAETINVTPTAGTYLGIGGWNANSFMAVRSDGGVDLVSKSGTWSATSVAAAGSGFTSISRGGNVSGPLFLLATKGGIGYGALDGAGVYTQTSGNGCNGNFLAVARSAGNYLGNDMAIYQSAGGAARVYLGGA